MEQDKILLKVEALMNLYRSGGLGGEIMPEDENPGLDRASKENYMYFTLPMALNYQRSSYALWASANRMFAEESMVFDSRAVCDMPDMDLREILVKYKVALQPNKQPVIWKKLCETIETNLMGDIRNLFRNQGNSVSAIKAHITQNRKAYPYLAGNKICNYWLYVMEQYTDVRFVDRENITVAPDTHVIQASVKLGLVSPEEAARTDIQQVIADRWKKLLAGTPFVPIDVHTPLWLWSHGKFSVEL